MGAYTLYNNIIMVRITIITTKRHLFFNFFALLFLFHQIFIIFANAYQNYVSIYLL